MKSPPARLRRLTLALVVVAFSLTSATCIMPEDPGGGTTVTTPFGDFIMRTIVVGGVAPAESFTKGGFIEFGPDGRLYVTSYGGSIYAITLDANHDPSSVQTYQPFGNRLLAGIAFAPDATAGNPVMYVVNNAPPLYGASDATGIVSRVDNLAAGTFTNIISGLPRSAENHMTFDLQFGSDGRLYISQGGNTNNGATSGGLFAFRPERSLSAALLVADVTDSSFSGIGDVEVYAPGLRNNYSFCLHSNGKFYGLDQGANAGLGDRPNPDGSTTPVTTAFQDELNVLLPDRYYGHPNPARDQYAFNADLSDGTPHQPAMTTFPTLSVVTGLAEYDSDGNGGQLRGKLLATGFVDGKLYYVGLSSDGMSVTQQGVLAQGFSNPLDVTVGDDGTIYILEAGGSLGFGGSGPAQITVLEPAQSGGSVASAVEMFSTAATCQDCHAGLTDASGNDVSLNDDWQSTMMANSLRDPLFRAKLSSEIARFPELKSVIEGKCAACHTPMARTQTLAEGGTVAILDDGFVNPSHPRNDLALDGVSCSACHQIQDVDLGEKGSFSGNYEIDSITPRPDRPSFGPFENPDRNLMRSTAGLTPTFSEHMSDAGMCATCHTLYTPTVDASGEIIGEFPEQTPYLEWEHSSFGDGVGVDQTCQDCHMPLAEGGVVLSPLPANLEPRSPFKRHHFVGGNTQMLDILIANIDTLDLGMAASLGQLQATRARTLAMLTDRTATLAVEAIPSAAGDESGSIAIEVTVTNLTGHKFPTGYPSRRAWLHVTVSDESGATVFESGRTDALGKIAGDDAAELMSYEPHYDRITDANQVQIYQPITYDSDGQVTYTLLRAHSYAKDNRILPSGFDKHTADADIAVYGAADTDDDFIGGSDQVTYTVDPSGYDAPYTIRVELLYQSISPVFVDDLRLVDTELVDRFLEMYDVSDRQPVIVASDVVTAP